MRIVSSWFVAVIAASMISLFSAGCGGSGKFDDFSDISVPDSYIRKKADAVSEFRVSEGAGSSSEETKHKRIPVESKSVKESAVSHGAGEFSPHRPGNSPDGFHNPGDDSLNNRSIPERLFATIPVNPSITSGYAAACEYLKKGETEIGIEKLKHLATMTYAEPEICSQIYFVIADSYEKTGNIRESNEFFDKFNDNIKKHRDSNPVQNLKSKFTRRDEILKKFYPPPGTGDDSNSNLDTGNAKNGDEK